MPDSTPAPSPAAANDAPTRPIDANALRITALESEVTGLSGLLESATEREADLRAQLTDAQASAAHLDATTAPPEVTRAVVALEVLALSEAQRALGQFASAAHVETLKAHVARIVEAAKS